MKNMIIVAVLTVFSVQAFGAARAVVREGQKPGMSKEQTAREEAKMAAKRGSNVVSGNQRAEMQSSMDQKAMASDLVRQAKADPNRCDVECVATVETIELLTQDKSRFDNDPASELTVNNLLLKINQDVVAGKGLGVAVDSAAAEIGIEKKGLIEACGK